MRESFYIYGAGIVATGVYTAIKELHKLLPIAFLVSGRDGNPAQIDGISVKVLSEKGVAALDRSAVILVAAPEVHHQSIEESLLKYGIHKEQIILVDNQLENTIMEQYYRSLSEFETLGEIPEETGEQNDIRVFQAKCHVDKPLKNSMETPSYVCPIQVGAALTDERITEVSDNIGENISGKNRNYCELTATYYAWKNDKSAYKGLCHYRRIFDIQEEKLQKIFSCQKDIDVILPYPSIHYPDIRGQHNRYVNEQDWNAMLQAINEVAPEYITVFDDIFSEQYFYNYNMLIAKREVFDDYCSFLFSVLERTEQLTCPKGNERADRFAGYLGENLTTLYFRANRDKLRIVHVGKIWNT